uniref:Uncharacterized protein n=1 Tax=Arcella intermedia TaxID=1963864 RepID=A0A6B2KWX4_9EUKA
MDVNYINSAFVDHIIEEVKKAKTIGRLILKDNRLNDIGVCKLIDFLISEQIELKNLYLFKNDITDIGAKHIALFISKTSNLPHEIHLSHNRITIEGAKAIFSAVKERGYPTMRVDSHNKPKPVPLWLRLEWNLIDVSVIYKTLGEMGLTTCSAEDRMKCTPTSCSDPVIPALHLYVIHLQYKPVEESTLLKETKRKVIQIQAEKKEKAESAPESVTEEKPAPVPRSLSEGNGLPLFIFLDTNAVINMIGHSGNKATFGTMAQYFTWKRLMEKSKKNEFGFTCFSEDKDKVCLVITNTVMQEVDHQKTKTNNNMVLKHLIVDQLQSETGYLSKAAEEQFLEVLGSHQGERLIQETGQRFIDMAQLNNPNLANDINLINVALFWNKEIGNTGTVVLITGDKGCLKMAKQHNLPASSLHELDQNLFQKNLLNVPWTASLLRECMPHSVVAADGDKMGDPIDFGPGRVFSEVREASKLVHTFLSNFTPVSVTITFKHLPDAKSVQLCGDFDNWSVLHDMTKVDIVHKEEDVRDMEEKQLYEDGEGEQENEENEEENKEDNPEGMDQEAVDEDNNEQNEDIEQQNDETVEQNEEIGDEQNEETVDEQNEETVDEQNEETVDEQNEETVDEQNEETVDEQNEENEENEENGDEAGEEQQEEPEEEQDEDKGDNEAAGEQTNQESAKKEDNQIAKLLDVEMHSKHNRPNFEWSVTLKLHPRLYYYKFLIDGQWTHDPSCIVAMNSYGNLTNILYVPGPNLTEAIMHAQSALHRWEAILKQVPTFAQ